MWEDHISALALQVFPQPQGCLAEGCPGTSEWCGSCWEAELRVGRAAYADFCGPAGPCSNSGKDNLVCFCQSVVAILALMKAFSEDWMKLFSMETKRFTCISRVVWVCFPA